jgi:hypothetical protein
MWQFEYNTIDELNVGDTKLRLVENTKSNRKFIQRWSSMQKQWNMMYRYEIDEAWTTWKKLANKRKLIAK